MQEETIKKEELDVQEKENMMPKKKEAKQGNKKHPVHSKKEQEKIKQETSEPKRVEDYQEEQQAKKIVELEAANKELQEKVLRISAEMQNMRRRMEEEKNHLLKYEGEDFIKELLPIVDNFERAIDMDDENLEDEVSKFLSGFKMIYGNINSILNHYDIQPIDVLKKPFDPNIMEAVMAEEIKDQEPNIVVQVFQKGYTYKGKVIRPAMVKVSK